MLQITETNYTTNLHLQGHLYQHNKCKLPCTQKIPKRNSVVLCNTTNYKDNKICKLFLHKLQRPQEFLLQENHTTNSCKQKIPNTFLHSDVIPSKNSKKNHIVPNQKSITQQKNPIMPLRCYSNTKVFLILPKTT